VGVSAVGRGEGDWSEAFAGKKGKKSGDPGDWPRQISDQVVVSGEDSRMQGC